MRKPLWLVFRIALAVAYALGLSTTVQPQSEVDATKSDISIRHLVMGLRQHRWYGIQCVGMSPTTWLVHVTMPMKELLKVGPAAQPALLDSLSDPLIQDQVILLLGGIGDEAVIGPIIDAMIPSTELKTRENAMRINFAADFALTNITTADVVWPHSGGNIVLNCPNADRKTCWQKWWELNSGSFAVENLVQRDRNYPHYPSYGIYRVSDNTGFWDGDFN